MKNYAPWEKKQKPASTPLRRSFTMGKAYSVVGLLVGGFISCVVDGEDWMWMFFFLFAALAAFVAGSVLWLVFVAAKPSPGRGCVAGGLAGVVSHWLCWMFIIVFWNFTFLSMNMPTSSLGEAPMTFVEAPFGASIFTLWSLYIFGWVTVPAGAVIGLVLGYLQQKSLKATDTTTQHE